MRINVVCPLAEKDVENYLRGLPFLDRYLDVKNFVVIGNKNVGYKISKLKKYEVIFVDESQLVSFDEVKNIIARKSENNTACIKRSGWYLQQFLKFSYSLICEDEYYLLWDADTLPIHKHIMFDGDKLCFDMKTEFHEPYFHTFERIFPQYNKRSSLSFISEHMLIKTAVMRELINEISCSNIEGDSWYEKIISAVDIKDLAHSGFADYETYGLFCINKYPELYIERKWDSLRPASSFFEFEKMRECDYSWILKDYDAVSFEASRKVKKWVNILCTNKYIQTHISCKQLLKLLHQFTI